MDFWVRKIHWRRNSLPTPVFLGFPSGSEDKASACNAGDLDLIPGLGRSPGGGHGNPLQYSCLENPHDLLAVQGTIKSLLQHHSSKASVLQGSVFFIVQLSHPYMATGKTVAFTRWTFVGRVMSLLFNMLSIVL